MMCHQLKDNPSFRDVPTGVHVCVGGAGILDTQPQGSPSYDLCNAEQVI
jgi:hypothetical protein